MSAQEPDYPKMERGDYHPSLEGYIRAFARLAGALTYTSVFSAMSYLACPLTWVAPGFGKEVRRRISKLWMHGLLWFLGSRITVHGELPKPPFFLVFNHPNWIDFFAMEATVDARFVAEAPLKTAPIVGVLFRGLNPLFVKRTKEDTDRILEEVVRALRAGDSVALAPENPLLEQPRGTVVRQFRAALFEAAVQTNRPVSCASITYRTPTGCPSALSTVVFHAVPIYRAQGSNTTDAELEHYGGAKIRRFFRYLIGMLSLPHHEIIVTFGDSPLFAEDKITLANLAHEAVQSRFMPVE